MWSVRRECIRFNFAFGSVDIFFLFMQERARKVFIKIHVWNLDTIPWDEILLLIYTFENYCPPSEDPQNERVKNGGTRKRKKSRNEQNYCLIYRCLFKTRSKMHECTQDFEICSC